MNSTREQQLEDLGIPIPPDEAFRVELTKNELYILLLYSLAELNKQKQGDIVTSMSANLVPVGDASAFIAVLAPASTNPRRLIITNPSVRDVFISLGTQGPSTSRGIIIKANGGYWESPFAFKDQVRGVVAGATVTVTVYTFQI